MVAQKPFYVDSKEGLSISYDELLADINQSNSIKTYCKCNSFYEIFLHLIASLVSGSEIVLLDSDFTDDEVIKLVGDSSLLSNSTLVVDNLTIDNFYQKIYAGASTWRISLFTSGTTGLPKKVTHTFQSLTRFLKVSAKHKESVWGFAYNPTHIAGLQVFFQALMNQNTIVRLSGLDREQLFSEIENNQITNISATPTFYRLLLPAKGSYISLLRITSGGEKFDEHTVSQLASMFPNARITNVYASTEAGTLFASSGNDFTIKSEFRHLIKTVDNELFLHHSLMGDSSSIVLVDGWYPTGDLITVVSEEPFIFNFTSRKNEMINVGGYKVNPSEVEDAIRLYSGVKDVCVYSKANRILGNIVCCDIVTTGETLSEKQIREFLQEKLQEFKIPRLMKFVKKLQTTRTGKLSRN